MENWIKSVWKFYLEDINRIIFPFKVGLSVLLVSLFILLPAPYEIFGTRIIWAIFTTVIMSEYTVGMTFSKGFNRAVGSLLAALLAIAIIQVAISRPIIIGISIFFFGASTSLIKLWPSLVAYEHAFKVTLFTFCMIILFAYRKGNPLTIAIERLYFVAIGGFIAVLVNVLVFPIWSGEELHNQLANSFYVVADSLQECVGKYLEVDGSESSDISSSVDVEFSDEPAYKKCKETLDLSNKLQTLANSAKWEPPHGRFKRPFFYPWSEYVKVGTVLRYCAYEVAALHGVLHSEIQAPHCLRAVFKEEIHELVDQAAELLRSLGKDISNMKRRLETSSPLLEQVHNSTEQLQLALNTHSYLFIRPIVSEDTLHEQSKYLEDDETRKCLFLMSSCHQDMIKKKQLRKLNSCPSIEVDIELLGAKEDVHHHQNEDAKIVPRMRTLESTVALSLATFTSLLIEFVARLDHLVEAVNELSTLAKFNVINDIV